MHCKWGRNSSPPSQKRRPNFGQRYNVRRISSGDPKRPNFGRLQPDRRNSSRCRLITPRIPAFTPCTIYSIGGNLP
nr:MAG TPA: hypothetical protein [Caudoviricetes sp.]